MNYTISARGSSAGVEVWATIWTVPADGGEGRPRTGSTSFLASGGGGEAGGDGEEGPGMGSASFPASSGRGEGGGNGEEGPGARCAEELSMRVEILS